MPVFFLIAWWPIVHNLYCTIPGGNAPSNMLGPCDLSELLRGTKGRVALGFRNRPRNLTSRHLASPHPSSGLLFCLHSHPNPHFQMLSVGQRVALPGKKMVDIAKAALAQHKKAVMTSACTLVAFAAFHSMQRPKPPPTPEELDRKYDRLDRFLAPLHFAMCLYFFWRVPLSICFRTPIAWGWGEVVLLCLLGILEVTMLCLELHRPFDNKGQKLYDFKDVWKCKRLSPHFWLQVPSV